MKKEMAQHQTETLQLKAELSKMKAFYDGKMKEKNGIIERQEEQQAEWKQKHESELLGLKSKYEREIQGLAGKIQGTTDINEKYMAVGRRKWELEKEVHELKASMRRMKGLNEGIDHLWQVKEAEYQNLMESMRQMKLN